MNWILREHLLVFLGFTCELYTKTLYDMFNQLETRGWDTLILLMDRNLWPVCYVMVGLQDVAAIAVWCQLDTCIFWYSTCCQKIFCFLLFMSVIKQYLQVWSYSKMSWNLQKMLFFSPQHMGIDVPTWSNNTWNHWFVVLPLIYLSTVSESHGSCTLKTICCRPSMYQLPWNVYLVLLWIYQNLWLQNFLLSVAF